MSRRKIVVLGTGGTIAGRAASPHDNVGYVAGQVAVADLLGGVAPPPGFDVATEQVAQLDSKDMEFSVWRALAARCRDWLLREDVAGIVVTHGTDTMEETAYFLHRVLPAGKPVVLTGAMRPASSAQPDGPRNLHDALAVAASAASGVCVAFAGEVHSALDVYKEHASDLKAFSSGDAGPAGAVQDGAVQWRRTLPEPEGEALPAGERPPVEIVLSHASPSGEVVEALVALGVRGIVAAGTGNGTLHHRLEAALVGAMARGVRVVRSTRCVRGTVQPHAGDRLPHSNLSPVKARIALMLELMR